MNNKKLSLTRSKSPELINLINNPALEQAIEEENKKVEQERKAKSKKCDWSETVEQDALHYLDAADQIFYKIKVSVQKALQKIFTDPKLKRLFPGYNRYLGNFVEIKRMVDPQEIEDESGRIISFYEDEPKLHYIIVSFENYDLSIYLMLPNAGNNENFSFTNNDNSAQFKHANIFMGVFRSDVENHRIDMYTMTMKNLKRLIKSQDSQYIEHRNENYKVHLINKKHFNELPVYDEINQRFELTEEEIDKLLKNIDNT